MAKDKSGKTEITRIDLRIPNHIFEEIEKLAIETNQPTHHITGKVITTPVILNLINLGLESVRKEDFGIEAIASKDSLKEAEIEKKITNTLLQNLEAIVSDKLTDIVKNEVNEAMNKLTLISELTDSKVKEDNSEVNEIKESAIKSNNSEKIDPPEDTETIEVNSEIIEDTETITPEVVNEDVSAVKDTEDNSEPNETIEVKSEDVKEITPDTDIKPYSEAEKEIKRLSKLNKSANEIAKILHGKYYTKRNSINWTDTQVRRIIKPKNS